MSAKSAYRKRLTGRSFVLQADFVVHGLKFLFAADILAFFQHLDLREALNYWSLGQRGGKALATAPASSPDCGIFRGRTLNSLKSASCDFRTVKHDFAK